MHNKVIADTRKSYSWFLKFEDLSEENVSPPRIVDVVTELIQV